MIDIHIDATVIVSTEQLSVNNIIGIISHDNDDTCMSAWLTKPPLRPTAVASAGRIGAPAFIAPSSASSC